jgi:predicted GNAT family acetyltransferase
MTKRDRHVVRNDEQSRYELAEDGRLIGICTFTRCGDGVVELPHTVIEPARRGHGLGAELVRAALDDLRTSGDTVVPTCWYVAEFIDDNPEYRTLLVS